MTEKKICSKKCKENEYVINFDGSCASCHSSCKSCRDDENLKEKLGKEKFEGHCMKCAVEGQIIDVLSGTCVDVGSCVGVARFKFQLEFFDGEDIEKNEKSVVEFCGFCGVEHCLECVKNLEGNQCDVCGSGYKVDGSGKCVEKPKVMKILLWSFLIVGFFALIVGYFFNKILKKKKKRRMRREKVWLDVVHHFKQSKKKNDFVKLMMMFI